MHRWLLWTLLAVFCWGIWALLGKVIGEALSPALTQAFSTIGLVPVMLVLGLTLKRQACANAGEMHAGAGETRALLWRGRGTWLALGAGTLTCLGNVAYYNVLNRG